MQAANTSLASPQPVAALQPAKPLVWSIAASDSGGGAGIQADVLTLQDLGCHACTAITAITAQNSLGVQALEPVSNKLFQAQLDALKSDLPARAIKIGLLPTAEMIWQLADWLQQYKQQHQALVVADPVLGSSSGQHWHSEALLDAWRALLPHIDVLTPNLPELGLLSGRPTQAIDEQVALLQALGASAVLVKGGHISQIRDVTDLLYQQDKLVALACERLQTPHQHGTGCTLSSALTALLAHGYPLEDALVLARAYLQAALEQGYATGAGPGSLAHPGWPTSQQYLPRISGANWPKTPTAPFAGISEPLGVYPVVDSIALLQQLLPEQPGCIQLRLKQGSPADLHAQIAEAVMLCRRYQVRLFINDHWQLAIELGAYGVHLGQEDLALADLTAIQQAGLRLGISSHGPFELARALQLRPSYVALGHVFPTQTKQMPSQPQGLKRLALSVPLCAGTPTVAIGGIDQHSFAQTCASKVHGIAMVSAITKATQPAQRLRFFNKLWEQHYAYHR
ncbi:thiamine phosphate synthase [Alkalimonas mucilaginosa]|uniref:Thiamine phosphate synthase n=1 Tax=Alkalimonas mucilaginosa TaxID=3057676 RepID=A0ABU7JJG7_9GAMM|nr:thiamine phosphate synthase [Alkalimonas sp. MEB004]MEE2025581.1 thiamine phosphate synthase [Alkalimonas sp. MEB004]